MNRPWWLALGLTLVILASCDDSDPPGARPADAAVAMDAEVTPDAPADPDAGPATDADTAPPAVTKAAVVSALAACSLEAYRAFAPTADDLAAATTALAADGGDVEARWSVARAAWTNAMGAWQEVEMHQYGPLAQPGRSPGGQDMRDFIYYWPPTTRCFVEQELVSASYRSPGFLGSALITQRGLGALEYLLFYTGTDNECAATADINSKGTWAALVAMPGELVKRKREYAAVLAGDVARRGHALLDAWEPGKGNFLAQVQTAGAGSTVFTSPQAVLNAQALALLYIDNPAKDYKLGRPLGLRECDAPPCLEALESRFALRSKNHLTRNMAAFHKLMLGCGAAAAGGDAGAAEGTGIDDLLVAMGPDGAAMAGRLRTHIARVQAALAAIPGDDLKQPLQNDRAAVMVLHDASKALLDEFKTELFTALNIELPGGLPTDTD
jgi:uncharacterized protein